MSEPPFLRAIIAESGMANSSISPKIAAAFVTYNRRADALKCVAHLLDQSFPLYKIVAVINNSTDGTKEALEEAYGAGDRLTIVNLPSNVGCAAGFRVAIREALGDPAVELVWIMDDDAHADREALNRLIEGGIDRWTVYSPLVMERASGQMSFPVLLRDPRRLARAVGDLPDKPQFRVSGAFMGALLPRQVTEIAGELDDRLFIRGEDEEYPRRLARAGFSFVCRRGAVLYHPRMKMISISLFGTGFGYEPGLALWKHYYQVRNKVYVVRIASRFAPLGLLKALVVGTLYMLAALFFDDLKGARFRTWIRATRDGLSGRLQNPDA